MVSFPLAVLCAAYRLQLGFRYFDIEPIGARACRRSWNHADKLAEPLTRPGNVASVQAGYFGELA